VESEKIGPLFRKEEKYARAAASSWIAYPAVRSALDAARPSAVAVTAPLLPYMVDQVQCMRFCWRVCGIGALYPDGSQEPNPFDPEGPDPWPLTDHERWQAGYIAAAFHQLVRAVTTVLHDTVSEPCRAGGDEPGADRAGQAARSVAWIRWTRTAYGCQA
jgi:hypothetical protein